MLEADWQATSAIVVCSLHFEAMNNAAQASIEIQMRKSLTIHPSDDWNISNNGEKSVASPCRWVFAFVFSVLIVAGGKSAAEPGPQLNRNVKQSNVELFEMGKAFGKAEMTWRFFEVHKDASTWCINHILMYFIRWINVRFVTTTAEAMPKQHLQWSAFQQRRPRDAAISDGWTFRVGLKRNLWLRLCRDGAINIHWTVGWWKTMIFMPIHSKYFGRSFEFFVFLKAIHPESLLQTSQRPLGQTLAWQRSCLPRHVEHICHGG